MRVFRKLAAGVAAAAAWWLVSCRDIPTPPDGVQSISALVLGSPGVVAGDTLRDSLGFAAPLSLIAYDVGGLPLDPQPVPSFVVIDTGARLADGRFIIGETPGTTVRVVGTVSSLQTLPVPFKVTLSPDTLVAADSTLHRRDYDLADGDSVLPSANLTVIVQHRATPPGGVEAVLVKYVIEKAPPAKPDQGPIVVLTNGNVPSSRDTTDNTGRAFRAARLRVAAMNTFTTDTVIVSANASYRGVTLGAVQFIIIYRNQ